ncbi:universal stress protein [soil metagenome]
MKNPGTDGPVVVGIDGSNSAVHAALWALEEAASRDVPILLVSVVDPAVTSDVEDAMAGAQHALHRAWERLSEAASGVKLESEVRTGPVADELLIAARGAAMLCLGGKGPNHAHDHRQAVVREVVDRSPSPVAVIRHQRGANRAAARLPKQWITVILDDSPGSAEAMQTAITEATLREAPLLALTSWSTTGCGPDVADSDLKTTLARYLAESSDDDADIKACALQMPHDLLRLLDDSAHTLMMVVVPAANRLVVQELVSPSAAKTLRKAGCSVLVVPCPG